MPSRSFFQPPKSGLNAPAQYPATDPSRLSVNVHNERRNAYAKVTKRTSRLAPEKAVLRPALACAVTAGALPEKAMAKEYWQKLKDPRWQRKRLEILSRADFSCEDCGEDDRTLNVHHRLYRKGAEPWDYTDAELIALCEQCHEREHHWRDRIKEGLAKLDSNRLESVCGYIDAMIARDHIFTDDEEKCGVDITVQVISYDHAFGLADGFGLQRTPMRVDQLIELRPLKGRDVWFLEMDGLDAAIRARGADAST
jgi:hypothetical protein